MAAFALTRRQTMAGLAFSPVFASAASAQTESISVDFGGVPEFHGLAPTPPMGWNSWDSFGPTITEEQARANAAVMAQKLLPHGYRVFTVDIQWYEPGANSFAYRNGAELAMDEWGRLIPAVNRFASAANGAGFKPLADYVHTLGLKFGIHVMRGIPRQAVAANTPIQGTPYRAADIADRTHVCEWNTDMFGVDMSKPGAQAYYDSIFHLYESWGVDFVKVDDMSRPYMRNRPEIEAVRAAINSCRRPMVLSLSPGETPLAAAAHVAAHANMWRISDDFWDTWTALREQFVRLRNWSALPRVAGAWPDADMLPLGVLEMGKRTTRFSADEQVTLMTLWSIARSPLIVGADLRKLDAATEALLTNDEVLGVDQASTENRELFFRGDKAAWIAKDAQGTLLALFNLGESPTPVGIDLAPFGFAKGARVRDLWRHRERQVTQLCPTLPAHGAGLYRLRPLA